MRNVVSVPVRCRRTACSISSGGAPLSISPMSASCSHTEVADAALAQEDEDGWIAAQVQAGHPVRGLFPMNAEWRARYEEWRAGQ